MRFLTASSRALSLALGSAHAATFTYSTRDSGLMQKGLSAVGPAAPAPTRAPAPVTPAPTAPPAPVAAAPIRIDIQAVMRGSLMRPYCAPGVTINVYERRRA